MKREQPSVTAIAALVTAFFLLGWLIAKGILLAEPPAACPPMSEHQTFVIPAEHVLRRRDGDFPSTLVQPYKGFRIWIPDGEFGPGKTTGVYDPGQNMTTWYPRNPYFDRGATP